MPIEPLDLSDVEDTTPSNQERDMARELVRSLRQSRDYAERLDRLRGHAMQGEAGPLDLAQKLDAMVQKISSEFQL